MRTSDVEFKVNGHTGNGYLARPDSDASAPAIVVIMEWWGLNEHIKDIARRYAAAGFVALAPDLYHGAIVMEPNEAYKKVMELDRPYAVKEIIGALEHLRAQEYVSPKKIGVVGYCMGGGLALMTATQSAEVGAVAAYYGGGAPMADQFSNNHAAILNITGEADADVTAAIKTLDAGFGQYTFPHEIHVYPGAGHAFFNDTRPEVHDPSASADAWTRTINWFQKYLTA